ncbi:MAG: alpha/beta fold hydrolase [Planctomycetaceae bacterium]|nr:alpha/beta fold hydrolase [Planctomycetaceae bacterium]
MKQEDFDGEYPFADRFVELDGHQYHYLDEGKGPVLLFVHGNPTWSFAWRHMVNALSSQYRCVAVDHIGCGRSDKPQDYPYTLPQHVTNLSRFIASLDLREITLVGHDWGGCIGMGAAVAAPQRFARFVLCNTAAFRSTRIPWRIAVCRIPAFGAFAVRGLNGFARAALTMAVSDSSRMTPAVRAGYLAPYGNWADRIATHEFVRDIPLKPGDRSYAALAEIEQGLKQFATFPMLLVWGERDWCFTTDFLAEWQRRFPQAETVRFPNAGHYVFEDAREALCDRLLDFLRRTDDQLQEVGSAVRTDGNRE